MIIFLLHFHEIFHVEFFWDSITILNFELLLVQIKLLHDGLLDNFLLSFLFLAHPISGVGEFHLMLSQAEDEIPRKLFYSREDVDILLVLWVELHLIQVLCHCV